MELGALTGMTAGFREREEVLHLLEFITGLRMNHSFVRPGGLAQDFPEGWAEKVTGFVTTMRSRLPDYDKLLTGQPIWRQRLEGSATCRSTAPWRWGPPVRSCAAPGLPWDLRKVEPYLRLRDLRLRGADRRHRDAWGRYLVRMAEWTSR
jgi:NADH-quinone oxidoreductase subunit D